MEQSLLEDPWSREGLCPCWRPRNRARKVIFKKIEWRRAVNNQQ